MHRSHQPPPRWVALGALTLGLLVPAGGARGQPPSASAALSPHVQFLGDAMGTVFTFTVTNPADGESVGMVEIDLPSRFWTARSCPQAPAGWTAETDGDGCSYQNPGDPAGDLAPGTSSSAFQLVATSGEATADRTGTFRVAVGGPDASDDDDLAPAAAAAPGGLDVTAYSFEVLDVVVASGPAAPGSPCPPANRTATAGAGQTLVVCGRNRTSQTLIPAAASSSLEGSLLQSPGSFSSGPVAGGPNSSSVVLGSWSGARTIRAGQGTTVTASIGSSSTQTSAPATLTGFVAVAAPVVANPQHVTTREDAPVGIVLGGSSGDGSPLTFALVKGPAHGTLSGSGPSLAYTPEAHYAGEDGFTFNANNGLSASPPASVAITVVPVNHPPAFVRGSDVAVVATAGPQRFVHWATGISAGPANESSQVLQFEVTGNTNPHLFSAGPAVSPSGDLTFTPNAGTSGSTTLTLVLKDSGGTANGGVDTSPPQTFTLTVVRPATPLADARSATTVEDTPSTLILAAGDPGGGVLTFSIASAPAHGTLGTIGPASCSGRPATCTVAVAYTPQAGYSGQDGFIYTVSSRQGTSSSAPVSIGVKPRPAAPPPASPPKAPPPRPAPPPRKGPTLSALSLARTPSGPPGVGLELSGSGYGCPSVYFFFDGSRIGMAHPDRAGQVQMTGLEIPGDAGIGRHRVETSCRASGTPVQVVSSFEVTAAALHRSVVMTSLPKPSEIDLSPKSTAASVAGAIALILLVSFPGGLLDTTLDEHYLEIRSMLGFAPRPRAAPRQPPAMLRVLGFVGFLAAGAVAGALLDPRFGLNRSTMALAVGLCLSLAVIFLGFELPDVAYRRRRFGEWGSIVLRPGALVLTAVLVGTSRLLNLQPGYLFGLIGGLAFSSELRGKVEGRLAVLTSLFILLIALSMWFVWVPVSHAAARPGAGFWVVAAEAALGGTFMAGLSSLVVGLIPLRELDGSKLKSWSTAGWVAVYLLGVYAYVQLILRPAAASGPDPHGQMWKALVAAGVFAALSITFWAYFRFRSRSGEASPAAESG
jgi:hypothetical protein